MGYQRIPRILVWIFLILCLGITPSFAFVFDVTDTNDTTRLDSLRGDILIANWLGGNNTIRLGQAPTKKQPDRPWAFHLTLVGGNEIAGQTGDLNVNRGSLTIIGLAPDVTIDATGLGDRIFQVASGARLTLENLTLTGGTAAGNGTVFASGGAGGAINNAGTLILDNCLIASNSSGNGSYVEGNGGGTEGGGGGGIFNLGTMTLNDCTLADNSTGIGVDGAAGGDGGGIFNAGTMTLNNCLIAGNSAGDGGGPAGNASGAAGNGGDGGGIINVGHAVLNSCWINNNVAGQGASGGTPSGTFNVGFIPGGWGGSGGSGAGFYNIGEAQLNFCTISTNLAGSGGAGAPGEGLAGSAGPAGGGAGIFNSAGLTLNTCTISGNICGNGGNAGDVTFFFSPENGNGASGAAGGDGGGIYNGGSFTATSCTIAQNQTGTGGNGGNISQRDGTPIIATMGGAGGSGGGIYAMDGSTNVLRNTLIALNSINYGGLGGTNTSQEIFPPIAIVPVNSSSTAVGAPGADGTGPDLAGDFISQKFNLIGAVDGSSGITNGLNTDQAGSLNAPLDPVLGPLQMNGGVIPTQALLSGSPAIDQGFSFGLRTDQRGDRRPYNNPLLVNAPGGDGSDIGAFEVQP